MNQGLIGVQRLVVESDSGPGHMIGRFGAKLREGRMRPPGPVF